MIHRVKQHFPNHYQVRGDVAYIHCTDASGHVVAKAKIDKVDLRAALFSRRWRVKGPHRDYVYGSKYRKEDGKRGESLARMLLGAGSGDRVVHINGNRLDCRRSNLVLKRVGRIDRSV